MVTENKINVIVLLKDSDSLAVAKKLLARQSFLSFESYFLSESKGVKGKSIFLKEKEVPLERLLEGILKELPKEKTVFINTQALKSASVIEKAFWALEDNRTVLGSSAESFREVLEDGLRVCFGFFGLKEPSVSFNSALNTEMVFIDKALDNYFKKSEVAFVKLLTEDFCKPVDKREAALVLEKYKNQIRNLRLKKNIVVSAKNFVNHCPGFIRVILIKVYQKLEREELTTLGNWKKNPFALFYKLYPDRFKKNFGHEVSRGEKKKIKEIGYVTQPKKKQKILVFCPWLTYGGVEAVVYEIINACRDSYEFSLITSIKNENPWTKRFLGVTDEVIHLPDFLSREHWESFVLSYVENHQVDLVFVTNSELGYQLAPILKKHKPDLKIIDLLHGELPYLPMDYFRYSRHYKDYLDHRIVITPRLKDAMLSKYGEASDRVSVIPNAIDAQNVFDPKRVKKGLLHSKYQIPKSKKIVLFVGRYSEEKGPDLFIKVAKQFLSEKEYHFVLEGEGPDRKKLEAMISEAGLSNTSLGGACDTVPESLADADFVIFPSVREGLPMLGLESMAMEKVIIAADVPGWQDLIEAGKTGYLVEREQIGRNKELLLDIFKNAKLNKKLYQEARAQALTQYDLSVFKKGYKKLFEDILG